MLSGEDRLKQLRWKGRRGMKELDVLFERFFVEQAQPLIAGEWPELEALLSCEDDVLLDWVSGRNLPQDVDTLNLIDALLQR